MQQHEIGSGEFDRYKVNKDNLGVTFSRSR